MTWENQWLPRDSNGFFHIASNCGDQSLRGWSCKTLNIWATTFHFKVIAHVDWWESPTQTDCNHSQTACCLIYKHSLPTPFESVYTDDCNSFTMHLFTDSTGCILVICLYKSKVYKHLCDFGVKVPFCCNYFTSGGLSKQLI